MTYQLRTACSIPYVARGPIEMLFNSFTPLANVVRTLFALCYRNNCYRQAQWTYVGDSLADWMTVRRSWFIQSTSSYTISRLHSPRFPRMISAHLFTLTVVIIDHSVLSLSLSPAMQILLAVGCPFSPPRTPNVFFKSFLYSSIFFSAPLPP